jgi:hypothetical protein
MPCEAQNRLWEDGGIFDYGTVHVGIALRQAVEVGVTPHGAARPCGMALVTWWSFWAR